MHYETCMLKIRNGMTVRNFEVMSNTLNVTEICTVGNYAQKLINCVRLLICNYNYNAVHVCMYICMYV
jgi:hypothetical protein